MTYSQWFMMIWNFGLGYVEAYGRASFPRRMLDIIATNDSVWFGSYPLSREASRQFHHHRSRWLWNWKRLWTFEVRLKIHPDPSCKPDRTIELVIQSLEQPQRILKNLYRISKANEQILMIGSWIWKFQSFTFSERTEFVTTTRNDPKRFLRIAGNLQRI